MNCCGNLSSFGHSELLDRMFRITTNKTTLFHPVKMKLN